MSDQYPPTKSTVRKLAQFCLIGGVLTAALLFPIVGGAGVASNHASDLVVQGSADLVDGEVPAVSTMVDATGKTIAWLYQQRRWQVLSLPGRCRCALCGGRRKKSWLSAPAGGCRAPRRPRC